MCPALEVRAEKLLPVLLWPTEEEEEWYRVSVKKKNFFECQRRLEET